MGKTLWEQERGLYRGAGAEKGRIAKRELVQVKGFAFSVTLCWIRKKRQSQCDSKWNLLTVDVEGTKIKEKGRKRRKD